MTLTQKAERHIIRDNLNIQYLFKEKNLKQLLIEVYEAGYKQRDEEISNDKEDAVAIIKEEIDVIGMQITTGQL